MSRRALLALVAALAGSAGLYALSQGLLPRHPTGFLDPEVGTPLLPGFEPGKIRRVEIRQGTAAVVLERRDGRWVVVSHRDRRADPETIGNLLQGCAEARIVDVRSPTDANLQAYSLREEEAVEVLLSSEGDSSPRRFSFGKFAEGPVAFRFEFFVRLPGSPKIFVVEGIRDYRLGWERLEESRGGAHQLKPDRFYDYVICRNDPKDVEWVEIRAGGRRLRVAPAGEESWKIAGSDGLPAGFEFDEKKFKATLYPFELEALIMSGYHDGPGPGPGLDPPKSEILLQRRAGRLWTLRIGGTRMKAGDDARYAMSIEGDPEIYLLNEPQWERLSQPPEEYGGKRDR